ncbi:hypothetical protein M3I54_24145 [Paraburkholderia sp. CNPSo 3274]|uniref:hypothetical protein n=1 Tax=Paraburkholderia sp. CNPSo 3274 TaxID=2940932 RepID=UPI0020B6E884|nr:hypothetical protein [Paraburkholderia sp. CNPSo 3274]MCP3710035.1 hypothetical protein [Paraburkholderia sp. CNPSo 3274]
MHREMRSGEIRAENRLLSYRRIHQDPGGRILRLLDDEARTELLCFLVVGQLFAFAREGVWLRTDHLIESVQICLRSNNAECDWLERARLVEASRVIAGQESVRPFPKGDADCIDPSICAQVGSSTTARPLSSGFMRSAPIT